MTTYRFPDGFLWAAAAAACQIEGAPFADGAGPSIQHRYAQTPGVVPAGQSEIVAADHYHRFREDVSIMGDLGLQAYQFSVSWSRVFPEGTGSLNDAGLDFYDRLTDALVAAGIAPVPILYVWDLPGVLQDRGGWANRDCAGWFADYASAVIDRLGDRATHWLTICEPWSIIQDYLQGGSAHTGQDLYAAARATHHLLLGHGRAVEAFRASDATGEIGTPSTPAFDLHPASDSEEDAAAVDRARGHYMNMFFDPVLKGEYPVAAVEPFGEAWPQIHEGDMATISTPVDFVGVTYYAGIAVGDGRDAEASKKANWMLGSVAEHLLDIHLVPQPGPPPNGSWLYNPDGVVNVLTWLSERYGDHPVYITENGTTVAEVDDVAKIEYIRDHLIAAHRAIAEGIDLRGWFVWAVMDTWEFSRGFQPYGLIKIDHGTLKRTVRSSGYWYRDVISANAVEGP